MTDRRGRRSRGFGSHDRVEAAMRASGRWSSTMGLSTAGIVVYAPLSLLVGERDSVTAMWTGPGGTEGADPDEQPRMTADGRGNPRRPAAGLAVSHRRLGNVMAASVPGSWGIRRGGGRVLAEGR
jgi:hypothetical protein